MWWIFGKDKLNRYSEVLLRRETYAKRRVQPPLARPWSWSSSKASAWPGGPLSIPEACICTRQAALELQHAFEKGMVHRDVKPHNLMWTPDGWVKILDFGLARFRSESGQPRDLTLEGTVLGTPDYLAPEQADNAHTADIRADIYSLGCTLYFLLTGQPPFPGGSLVQKLTAHANVVPPPISTFRPEAPAELVRVVARMLAKKPQDRYQTPAEVAQALVPFLRSQPAAPAPAVRVAAAVPPPLPTTIVPPPLPPSSSPRRRRWLPWAVAAAVGLAIVLGVVLFRVTTDAGVVEIETDDPAVEVVVQENGRRIAILDGTTKRRVELRSGTYEVKLVEGRDELTLETDRFVLKRGDKEIVRVKRTAARADPLPAVAVDSKRPVPADALKREDISPYELAVAGNGDPKNALPELVAILGDSRMKHWSAVSSIAFSPDGKQVVTASRKEGSTRFWNTATGMEERGLEEAVGGEALAFRPDGRLLITGGSGEENLCHVWNCATRKRAGPPVDHHRGIVTSIRFGPDGTVVTAAADGTVCLWDALTGALKRPPIAVGPRVGWVCNATFTPEGRHLVVANRNGTVYVLRLAGPAK